MGEPGVIGRAECVLGIVALEIYGLENHNSNQKQRNEREEGNSYALMKYDSEYCIGKEH